MSINVLLWICVLLDIVNNLNDHWWLHNVLLFPVYLCFIIFVWCGSDIHFSDLTDVSPQPYDAVWCIHKNKVWSCWVLLVQWLECFLSKYVNRMYFSQNITFFFFFPFFFIRKCWFQGRKKYSFSMQPVTCVINTAFLAVPLLSYCCHLETLLHLKYLWSLGTQLPT